MEFITALLLFYILIGPEVRGILAPWSEIEPAPAALESEVLTIGLPAKSREMQFKRKVQVKSSI